MELKKNILATLAYYDVFDWPLKSVEILAKMIKFEHLNVSDIASPKDLQCPYIEEVCRELDQLVLDRVIDCADGFYFLAGREHLVPLRLKREKIAKRKWRLARRAVWWLRFVPYVRAVFASGSLAMRNPDELSDLDVLIVVKHSRIWLTRFLILVAVSLLGMRRKAEDKIAPDKICPNHFITDKSLHIPFQSIYTAQTYANLVPIYLSNLGLIGQFQEANGWVLDYVVGWNIEEQVTGYRLQVTGKITEWLLDVSSLGRILENWLRRYQSQKIARGFVAANAANGHVVFNDEQLAFHPGSIEEGIIREYNNRLLQMSLADLTTQKDSCQFN